MRAAAPGGQAGPGEEHLLRRELGKERGSAPGAEGPHRLPHPLQLTFLCQVFVNDQLPMSQVVQHGPKVGGPCRLSRHLFPWPCRERDQLELPDNRVVSAATASHGQRGSAHNRRPAHLALQGTPAALPASATCCCWPGPILIKAASRSRLCGGKVTATRAGGPCTRPSLLSSQDSWRRVHSFCSVRPAPSDPTLSGTAADGRSAHFGAPPWAGLGWGPRLREPRTLPNRRCLPGPVFRRLPQYLVGPAPTDRASVFLLPLAARGGPSRRPTPQHHPGMAEGGGHTRPGTGEAVVPTRESASGGLWQPLVQKQGTVCGSQKATAPSSRTLLRFTERCPLLSGLLSTDWPSAAVQQGCRQDGGTQRSSSQAPFLCTGQGPQDSSETSR